MILFRLLACAFAGVAAQEEVRTGPPFPEVWDPFPLRFPYAEAESLYLPRPKPEAIRRVAPREISMRLARKPVRVLLARGRVITLRARAVARLQMRRPDGSIGEGPRLFGSLRVERKNGEFRVAAETGRPFSTGPAMALRFQSTDPTQLLETAGKPYRGNLEFHPEGAELLCVNSLPMREYLRGVVPLEMGRRDESGIEALKAQAVVARTYAFKRMAERGGAPFDVHPSVQDQVYGGAAVEYALSNRAVDETDGLALLHADTLAYCYYHSTCGGVTASRHEVWNGQPIPYLISRPDRDAAGQPWCRASSYLRWTQSWETQALAGILRSNLSAAGEPNPPPFRSLLGLRVRERYACGRIRALDVETDGGTFTLRGDKIRFGLKPGNGNGRILESARFDIEFSGARVTARGSGFGHGVGLCQMGALGRAQAGQPHSQILAAYYPGTTLAKAR